MDLRSYVLNDGICKAFTEAVKLNPEVMNSVILEDNQLSDERLGILMDGLDKLEVVKTLHIKNNEFLEEGLNYTVKLMERRFPRNLEELRLISVKTSPLIMSELVETLAEDCVLKKLGLIACQLSDTNVPFLV